LHVHAPQNGATLRWQNARGNSAFALPEFLALNKIVQTYEAASRRAMTKVTAQTKTGEPKKNSGAKKL